MTNPSSIIPCLRYRDGQAAIDWLCATFGFAARAVYKTPDGAVEHAELTLGGGMIMLGSVKREENEWGRLIRQPDQIGGVETQCPFVFVEDVDAVYRRVQAAGVEILMEIKDEAYGRGFSCRDFEGHIWSLGSYNPWSAST